MAARAAVRLSNALTAAVVIVCSADKLATPLPSLAVTAIAASTSARLALVTPVIPRAAKSAAVRARAGVPPAAVSMIAATMSASRDNSTAVSTLVVADPSMTSLSRLAPEVVVI